VTAGSRCVLDLHVGEISLEQVAQFLCWPSASDGHGTALQRLGDYAAVTQASTGDDDKEIAGPHFSLLSDDAVYFNLVTGQSMTFEYVASNCVGCVMPPVCFAPSAVFAATACLP
jgi:hypothetical protein